MMAEGEIMIVGKNDAERIATLFGEKPKNGSHLFGLIYALQQQVADAKAEADTATKDLKAYEGLAPGRVVIRFGEQWQNAKNGQRARMHAFAGVGRDEILQNCYRKLVVLDQI